MPENYFINILILNKEKSQEDKKGQKQKNNDICIFLIFQWNFLHANN